MSFLFTLLWLASNLLMVVFILVTLLEKDIEKKRKNRRVWLIALAVAVISFIIMMVTADSMSLDNKSESVEEIENEEIVERDIKENEDKESEIEGTNEKENKSNEFEIEDSASNESDSFETEELEVEDIVDKYSTDFIVGASMTLDRYIANYKISLAPQKWKIVKFDDTDTLIGRTEITYKDRKGDFYFVGTLEFDGEKVTAIQPHFIYVIDEVIDEDGYCDDVFDKISNMGK